MQNLKRRASFRLFVVLALVFAALPALAEAVPDLKWEGVDSDTGRWKFSWETTTGEYWATVQYETNPDTWTTLSNLQWSREGSRTLVSSPALSNDPSGQTFNFRVKVKACGNWDEDEAGRYCMDHRTYGWTELEVEFD